MTVLVLSLTDVPSDPRVDGLCRALAGGGLPVLACGFGDRRGAVGYRLKAVRRGRPGWPRALGRALRMAPAAHAPVLARLGYGLDVELGRMSEAVGPVEPDLVWACGFRTLVFGAEIKRRKGAPLVYDARDGDPGAGPDGDGRFAPFRAALEGQAIGAADHVVAASEAVADALGGRFALRRRPTVVADGASAEAWLDVSDGLLPRDRRPA